MILVVESEWVSNGVELLGLVQGKAHPHPVHGRLPIACESLITGPGAGTVSELEGL